MNKLLFSATVALSLSSAVLAEPPSSLNDSSLAPDLRPGWWKGNFATGNWNGLRDRLDASGIAFDSYYVTDIAGNPVGGKKRDNLTYTDNFYLGISFDLDKLMGWRGATFAVSAVNRDGPGLSERYVGSQYDSQQVHGGQNFFLYDVTLEQRFWDGKAKFKIGRFGASDDFNTSPIYGLYMNNGIDGNIRNVLFDTQFSAYPFATWAARFQIDPTPEFNAKVGVFQTWNNIFDRTHNGVNWNIRPEDGVMILAQVGWTPELFKQPVTVESKDGKSPASIQMKGLPGHYWIGGSISPWNGYRQFGKPQKAGNSYGFYAHADQMVYQEQPGSDRGLTLWAASALYPQENISIMPFQVNAGAIYKGLIPSRGEDQTILGLIYGKFSRDYARSVRATGAGFPTHEAVIEAAYRINLTKFAYIQPDVQYIVRPSGTGKIPNALVIGAQIGITF